ncbi:hypothetical protein L2D25_24485 [Salmonella enterica subsp. enterica serovar Muenchen]|uniref:hypothetical protein n=1 Tax=Salmonella enterica TaxID=28901 RepID=UPI0015954953|nr:hypothetical protein [Salmonella enterica]EEH0186111.1 hypothetical protein [Salmonella enterica subsp. enterica serovar Oranienburg]EHN1695910.1 hypothetical protein [Salmonella enterica subsp. enterica serovar Newport]ELD8111787.1 hypothetical protein [Salmonella enterica subsp. enterica serovar Benin]EEI1184777.1 hypothetical protein [Salmonella enterica subsp. enterica serovar Oranienburg]EEO5752913.1 hypothetical protein [Salmonella enterica]
MNIHRTLLCLLIMLPCAGNAITTPASLKPVAILILPASYGHGPKQGSGFQTVPD